jgi:hypothetical protein
VPPSYLQTDMAVASIRVNLRARMFHFDQIAVLRDGSSQAATHNKNLKPVVIPSYKDPDFIEWLKPQEEKEVIVGHDVSCSTFVIPPHRPNASVGFQISGPRTIQLRCEMASPRWPL